jgi:PIN domain nuclease of toxin-antitoxin system
VKLLLDTHILLWAIGDTSEIRPTLRRLLEDPDNQLIFSALSLWEIAIKKSRGRSDFQVDPVLFRRSLMNNGYTELPITSEHAVAVESLPPIHKDPFDRLLIAQATVEGILLLTVDKQLTRYPGPIRKV